MGGIPTDKQAAVNYFASQRGISPSRYQIIDGDIAYQADDGKFYKEVSGLGATAAYYAPDVMEMAPDVGAGVALAPLSIGGPLGTATAVGGVSAVAAGTNYLRQKIAGKIAGQELDPFQVVCLVYCLVLLSWLLLFVRASKNVDWQGILLRLILS